MRIEFVDIESGKELASIEWEAPVPRIGENVDLSADTTDGRTLFATGDVTRVTWRVKNSQLLFVMVFLEEVQYVEESQ